MSASSQMKGARLEYVLKEIKGQVTKVVTSYDKTAKKLVHKEKTSKADTHYMLFTPNGNCYRLTHKEVVRRGLNKQPAIMNLDRVNDVSTPAGRFKFAINDAARQAAYAELENEVIRLCTRRTGHISLEGNVDGTSTTNAA